MRKRPRGLAALLGVVLVLSMSGAFGADETEATPEEVEVTAAPLTHACSVEAPGDGCVFDLTATGKGTLKVDTQADTPGDLWQVCAVQVGAAAACKIGTGSTTSFTGLIQKGLAAGKTYEVFVIYEAPLPDPFPPTSVQVRFYGPVVDQDRVTIVGPRLRGPGVPVGPGALVAQTGQAQCRDAAGTAINCAGTGQDGEF
jgi:hypothetical protein